MGSGRDGWMCGGEKNGCVTSGEQAVSTVGGSWENGIIHVLLAHSVYLSLFASLPPFLSRCRASTLLLIVQQKKKRMLPPIH